MRLNLIGLISVLAPVACEAGRLDTHFHALPPQYVSALKSHGGDPSGFPTPQWSLNAAIKSMDAIGTDIGFMSVSSPGVLVAGTGEAARQLARVLNNQLANYTQQGSVKNRLGFFGALTDFQDVNGTVSEIEYLFKTQKRAVGVIVYTSYGGKLLGHPDFIPIWDSLQKYKALVFLHPSVLDVTPKYIGPSLPQPIVDYPLATTRAAVDLVLTGRFRTVPDVDIILAHAGGTIPFIASRAINALALPEISGHSNVGLVQAKSDFARFYYDIALSTSEAQLDGLLDFAQHDHIVFGSDFPYVPQKGIDAVVAAYEKFVATNSRGNEIGPGQLRNNAVRLLKKHTPHLHYQ